MALDEPSHQNLRCLTFSLTYNIIVFPTDSLLKKKNNKEDDKYSLKSGAKRVKQKIQNNIKNTVFKAYAIVFTCTTWKKSLDAMKSDQDLLH